MRRTKNPSQPMQITSLLNSVDTPAFVYDETEVGRVLKIAESLHRTTGCQVLYSLKPLCFPPLLEFMAPKLDGFAVSSPFEARMARSILGNRGRIHFTSPGIRPGEVEELATLCDYVVFNSLTQWERFGEKFLGRAICGLRLNPGLSFLDDERYDPCREDSKLGIGLESLSNKLKSNEAFFEGIDGALIHSNCESTDFTELEETVVLLERKVPQFLGHLKWINLGGGYLFSEGVDLSPLQSVIRGLQSKWGLEVYLEPGAAFVRSAGYMVATVLDIFPSGDKFIAILDTTVNHMPELLEFDYEPDIDGHIDDGKWECILAGCTCLAGDLFGEYRFSKPLSIGDKVIFRNVGSYTLTKAHMFNGINLPSIYSLDEGGELTLLKTFVYEDFASRWKTNAGSPV